MLVQPIDISWPLDSNETSYKNSKPATFLSLKNLATDGVCDSAITLNSHTGTHIDAPAHFLEHGTTIEHVALTSLIGTCVVLDLSHVTDGITVTELQPFAHLLTPGIIILLKTRNSTLAYNAPFDPLFIYLEKSGAQYLVDKKIATVGIDYLGIERSQPAHETHTILMHAGIIIIEGLRLAMLTKTTYHFICLPLAIKGLEAAPARAVVIPQ